MRAYDSTADHAESAEGDQGEEHFLLLKLTVTITPYGTMIFIPRNVSSDLKRDFDWRLIGELIRCRVAAKQGEKLSSGRTKRVWRRSCGRKRCGWGIKGEARYEYVREKMGRPKDADPGWLWRLLRRGRGSGSSEKLEARNGKEGTNL